MIALVGCGTLSLDLTVRIPASNSVRTSSGGNSAWVTTASTVAAPAAYSAFAHVVSVPPDETMSSTSSTGRPANSAGSAKLIATERSLRRVFWRDRVLQVEPAREIGDPRPRFLVGPHNYRGRIDVARTQRRGNRWHGRKIVGVNAREDVVNVLGAVQMGVDRDHAVDVAGQKPADRPLADRLAVVKGRILPHVAEVGRNQHQPLGAAAPQRFRREQQRQQLIVGMIERRVNDGRCRRGSYGDAQLAVRKAMHLDRVRRNAEPCGQPGRFRRGARQVLQDGAVHGFISSSGEREPTI